MSEPMYALPTLTFSSDGPVERVRKIHVYDDQGVEVWVHVCEPGETSVQMPPVVEVGRTYMWSTELEWVEDAKSGPQPEG